VTRLNNLITPLGTKFCPRPPLNARNIREPNLAFLIDFKRGCGWRSRPPRRRQVPGLRIRADAAMSKRYRKRNAAQIAVPSGILTSS
jgi:hypothetical protein